MFFRKLIFINLVSAQPPHTETERLQSCKTSGKFIDFGANFIPNQLPPCIEECILPLTKFFNQCVKSDVVSSQYFQFELTLLHTCFPSLQENCDWAIDVEKQNKKIEILKWRIAQLFQITFEEVWGEMISWKGVNELEKFGPNSHRRLQENERHIAFSFFLQSKRLTINDQIVQEILNGDKTFQLNNFLEMELEILKTDHKVSSTFVQHFRLFPGFKFENYDEDIVPFASDVKTSWEEGSENSNSNSQVENQKQIKNCKSPCHIAEEKPLGKDQCETDCDCRGERWCINFGVCMGESGKCDQVFTSDNVTNGESSFDSTDDENISNEGIFELRIEEKRKPDFLPMFLNWERDESNPYYWCAKRTILENMGKSSIGILQGVSLNYCLDMCSQNQKLIDENGMKNKICTMVGFRSTTNQCTLFSTPRIALEVLRQSLLESDIFCAHSNVEVKQEVKSTTTSTTTKKQLIAIEIEKEGTKNLNWGLIGGLSGGGVLILSIFCLLKFKCRSDTENYFDNKNKNQNKIYKINQQGEKSHKIHSKWMPFSTPKVDSREYEYDSNDLNSWSFTKTTTTTTNRTSVSSLNSSQSSPNVSSSSSPAPSFPNTPNQSKNSGKSSKKGIFLNVKERKKSYKLFSPKNKKETPVEKFSYSEEAEPESVKNPKSDFKTGFEFNFEQGDGGEDNFSFPNASNSKHYARRNSAPTSSSHSHSYKNRSSSYSSRANPNTNPYQHSPKYSTQKPSFFGKNQNSGVKGNILSELERAIDQNYNAKAKQKLWKKLLLKYHPDKSRGDKQVATDAFQFLQQQKGWFLG